MDHHTSWFSFIPWYNSLQHNMQEHYAMAPGGMGGPYKYESVQHVFAAALVVIVLLVLAFIARMQLSDKEAAIIPSKKLSVLTFFELFAEAMMGMMETVIGPDYKRYAPVILTCGLYILFSNLLGLVPGFSPPTNNLNTTLAAAAVVFVWFNYHGFRAKGFGHITHMLNPIGETWGWLLMPLLGVVEVISVCARLVSLSLRLAGNMIGDHAVIFAFAAMFPLLLPLPFYALGTLVSLIQTAVFCILSAVYIAQHTADDGH